MWLLTGTAERSQVIEQQLRSERELTAAEVTSRTAGWDAIQE
jgi:hypothetical protein